MDKSLLTSLSSPGKVETCGKGGLLPTILVALTMDIVAPLNKRPHPAPVYAMPMLLRTPLFHLEITHQTGKTGENGSR